MTAPEKAVLRVGIGGLGTGGLPVARWLDGSGIGGLPFPRPPARRCRFRN